ncbi:hypothetical protein LTR10_001502 [Elasticomyces elasticus]|nr:hypothetical protein LTR10_001502 [Elasticomyces elasticus]KAK4975006.1 hypothetical protein LTR42_004215 [Elasticomyces elasticus]
MDPFQNVLGGHGNTGNGGGFPPGQPLPGSNINGTTMTGGNSESMESLFQRYSGLMLQNVVARGRDPVCQANAIDFVRNLVQRRGEGYRVKLLRDIGNLERGLPLDTDDMDISDDEDDEINGFYGYGPGMGGYPGGGYPGYPGYGGGFGGFGGGYGGYGGFGGGW